MATTALTVTLMLAGCRGSGPDGIYSDNTGRVTLEFRSGKAYMNLGGAADTDGTPFDVNGDKITIHYPSDGMMAQFSNLTINSDGSLQSGMGILKKK
ncbi:MAG: hypothetical protein ACREQT_04495 [Candidatus Binataceae bacterium]